MDKQPIIIDGNIDTNIHPQKINDWIDIINNTIYTQI